MRREAKALEAADSLRSRLERGARCSRLLPPRGRVSAPRTSTGSSAAATRYAAAPNAPEAARALLDLYAPLCLAHAGRSFTVAHLGQSLDGYIATASGDSYYVTGPDNVRHLHRLRALSAAVVVGAGTVARDDPQLTVRHVAGPNPVRVVLDPRARLDARRRVFTDGAAPTLVVHAAGARCAGAGHARRFFTFPSTTAR